MAASDFSVSFWGFRAILFLLHIGHGSTPARSFIQATKHTSKYTLWSKTFTENQWYENFQPFRGIPIHHTSRSMEVRLASYFATGHLVAVGTATQVLRWSDVASSAAGGSLGGLRLVHLGRLERLSVDEKWPVETWVV